MKQNPAPDRQRRPRILEAAELVFGEIGYKSATLLDVSRRSGLGEGFVYQYFPDTKTLFVALIHDLSRRLRLHLSEAIGRRRGRMAIERAGFQAFFSFASDHPYLFRIVRQAEYVDMELFRWYYRRMAEAYAHVLERAMDQGQVRRLDPEVLAYALMGIGEFVAMRWAQWDEGGVPEAVLESMMDFIHHGMDALPRAE